jgi:hypothetical protein
MIPDSRASLRRQYSRVDVNALPVAGINGRIYGPDFTRRISRSFQDGQNAYPTNAIICGGAVTASAVV